MIGTLGVIGGTLGASGGDSPLVKIERGSATVTADGSANTKGAWTEVVAATSGAATFVILGVQVSAAGVNTGTLLDLAIGGAGSEVAFLENLPVGSAASAGTAFFGPYQVPLPVSIASGARVSARIQCATGGRSAGVILTTFSGGAITPGALTVIGANTGISRGVSLGTSWTEIVASTAAAYRYLVPVPSAGSTTFTGVATADSVYLGSGGSGSEVQIGDISINTSAGEDLGPAFGYTPWTDLVCPGVASGTRLAMKRGASVSSVCDGAIIGVI